MIRVIAGEAKGRKLKLVDDPAVRPSSGRVKEAMFSSIGPRVSGENVLDLYAGSGALGIEALSRGAAHATFVEKGAKAAAVIEQNLDTTGLASRGAVEHMAAEHFADRPGNGPYGLVFADPPYMMGLPAEVLLSLRRWDALAPGCLIVVELASRAPSVDPPPGFVVTGQKRYGDTALLYIKEA